MQKGCPKCGRLIDENLKNCPYCNYDFSELDKFFKNHEEKEIKKENKYAGFIKRLVAGMIDVYIFSIITFLIIYLLSLFTNIKINMLYIDIPLFVLIYILFSSLLERTSWHGSLGKNIVKIEVLDVYENPITFTSSLVRNVVKFLNIFTLGIGLIMCIFNEKKQTLGDKLTNNYVLSKISFKEEEYKNYAGNIKRLFAFIIDISVISLLVIGINYAVNYLSSINQFINNSKDIIIYVLSIVIILFYFPMQESNRGFTIGKKAMKIKLTNIDESILNFPKAFIREFMIIIEIPTFGFLLPISNKKNQTLKDILTKTIVINN